MGLHETQRWVVNNVCLAPPGHNYMELLDADEGTSAFLAKEQMEEWDIVPQIVPYVCGYTVCRLKAPALPFTLILEIGCRASPDQFYFRLIRQSLSGERVLAIGTTPEPRREHEGSTHLPRFYATANDGWNYIFDTLNDQPEVGPPANW